LVEEGQVPDEDAWRTFNMGVGLVLIVAEDAAHGIADVLRAAGEDPWELGTIGPGEELSWA
jgi:phosphoribosylformylglycinamidine cyclo-ligase